MITIILEDSNSRELERISEPSNTEFLIQVNEEMYPFLSQLSEHSYDVFSSQDMPGLIQDLLRLNETLNDPKHLKHLSAILSLAERCQEIEDTVLIFTPWGDE